MKREPARLQVDDVGTERAIDEVRRSTVELVRDPFLNGRDLVAVLPSGLTVNVRHGLARAFNGYSLGAPIGAIASGLIVESPSPDPKQYVQLTATGYGADITIRMRVW